MLQRVKVFHTTNRVDNDIKLKRLHRNDGVFFHFKEVIVNSLIDKRLNFEVNPIQFNLWMSFPPLTILHQQVL